MSDNALGMRTSVESSSRRFGLSQSLLGSVGVKNGVKGHSPLRFRVSLGDGTHKLEVLR